MSAKGGDQDKALAWGHLQELSDGALVGQVLAGNHDAFAVIVDRYQRLVFSVAVRIVKDEGEAEDVVQIVFLDIFRKAAQFDPARGTLKVWILQCAYHRSLNRREHLDSQQLYSRVELSEGIAQDEVKQFGNRKTLEPGEASRLVDQAFASLNAKQREAIEVIYFEGLTFPEAAIKTGETLAATRHHYYRGLAKIRDFLESGRPPNEPESEPTEREKRKFRWEVANVKTRTI